MLFSLIAISICDISAFYYRGKSYIGVEISNILYFIMQNIGIYLWFLYIYVKFNFAKEIGKTLVKTGIPHFVLSFAILLNPITDMFFTVDSNNIYHRNWGVFSTWVIEWGYLLAALIINIVYITKEKSDFKRNKYRGYLGFAIPLAIAAIIQMKFYGTTVTQVGFMISMLMLNLNRQYYQVQRDELTNLNNRNALMHYKDTLFFGSKGENVTVFFMDVDGFKSINDTYGHLKGDKALQDAADILKSASGLNTSHRLSLFRYGGDEFAVIGIELTENDIQAFKVVVNDRLEDKNKKNRKNGEKYYLSMSIGVSTGYCENTIEFDKLLNEADKVMYNNKEKHKNIPMS